MTFLVDLSLVDLDPCKVEECIRESGWVIIDKSMWVFEIGQFLMMFMRRTNTS